MEDEKKTMFMPLNLQFFAEGEEDDDVDDDIDDEGGEGTENKDDKGGKGKSTKTFSQDEVTKLLTREKNQGRQSVLSDLGLDDLEALKAIVAEKKAQEEKNKTDLEKKDDELALALKAKQASELATKQLEAKLDAISLGVNPKRVDDVVTLAMAKVTDEKDLKEVLSEMKTAYSNTDFFVDKEEEAEENKGTRGKLPPKGAKSKKDTEIKSIAERLLGGKKETKKSSYFSN